MVGLSLARHFPKRSSFGLVFSCLYTILRANLVTRKKHLVDFKACG